MIACQRMKHANIRKVAELGLFGVNNLSFSHYKRHIQAFVMKV